MEEPITESRGVSMLTYAAAMINFNCLPSYKKSMSLEAMDGLMTQINPTFGGVHRTTCS